MQRIGFKLQVRPERLDEYRRLHNPIWPELAEALRAAGIRNYSLFLADDGVEFGCLECDDWDAVCAKLAVSDVHTRWQVLMQDFLLSPINADQGGQPVQMMTEVFRL